MASALVPEEGAPKNPTDPQADRIRIMRICHDFRWFYSISFLMVLYGFYVILYVFQWFYMVLDGFYGVYMVLCGFLMVLYVV